MNSLFRNKQFLDIIKLAFNNGNSNCKLAKNLSTISNNLQQQEKSVTTNKNELNQIKNVTDHVQELVQDQKRSRLFAVVMVAGSQYKITTYDVIIVRNPFYPTIGDKIRLEKVLLVGGKDFSLVGKPLVSKEVVRVEATVIEKTLSNNVIVFRYKPRKDNRRMDFHKGVLTLLRINSIDVIGPLPNTQIK